LLQGNSLVYLTMFSPKDKGSNLNTLASTLLQVVNCEPFQLTSPYVDACFGHVMSKTCEYVILDDLVCVGMTKLVLLKIARSTL
jgi:hypothetical protein